MSENIQVSRVIPARPERVYEAWLSGDEHGKMIGSTATYENDGSFSAWDGYITGRTLEKTPATKIVQTWRTTEFPQGAPDSKLTVLLEPTDGGTKVTLKHDTLPDGQGESYESGWVDHYFEPMSDYFGSAGEKLREVGDDVRDAAEKVGEAIEQTGEEAMAVVNEARKSARNQAMKAVKSVKTAQKKAVKSVKTAQKKAVKSVKKVQKRAVAQAKKFGARVKALVSRRPKKKAAKKVVKKGAKKSAARRR